MKSYTKMILFSLVLIMLIFTIGCSGGPVAVTAVTQENPTAVAESEPATETPPTATSAPPTATAVPPTATAEPEPTATIPPEPTAPPEPTESPGTNTVEEPNVAPPRDETLEIAGAAGLTIQTTLKTPAGNAPFPGVMLLHMLGSNRAVWGEVGLMDQLLRSGYAVIAVDMRGHGETGGDPDWVLAETDLQLVWEAFTALPEVDGARTAVVGASIGSNMSLITGANIPAVQTVVMLSPGLDYRGVMPGERLGDWGERPLFIAASEEDAYSADSSRTLVEEAAGEAVLQMYQGAGHGTNMFSPQPDLIALILDWLNEHL